MAEVEITYKGSSIATMNASGTKTLGTAGKYCEGDIEVEYTRPSAPSPSLQSKTVSPTTSQQTVSADAGYDGLSSVTVNAMPSGTAGTPTATKGAVSSNSVSVTPSVTNTTGYITGGTVTGTAVTVSASELVSGTKTISASGTTDVTNYASASVAAGSATTPATTITANPSILVSNSGLISATVSGSQSITPTVSAGYVSSGTAGTITVSGGNTRQMPVQSAQTYTPTTTDQTIAANRFLTGTQTIKGDANLLAENIKKDVVLFGVTGTLESGGSSWTKITSTEVTVSTTSTSYQTVTTISAGAAAGTSNKIVWVKIRDKAGKRNGYFYGSDAIFINYPLFSAGSSNTSPAPQSYRYNSNRYYVASSSIGVFADSVDSNGDIRIRSRYNSSTSSTIDGTFTIDVYTLDYPSGVTPFD